MIFTLHTIRKWKSNHSFELNKLWDKWWIFYNRWQSFYKIPKFILPFMVCHICTTQLKNTCKNNTFVLHTFMKNWLPTASNHFSKRTDNGLLFDEKYLYHGKETQSTKLFMIILCISYLLRLEFIALEILVQKFLFSILIGTRDNVMGH